MKSKKKNTKTEKTKAITTGARQAFLERNPAAAKLQTAHLTEITTRIGDYRTRMTTRANDWIDAANEARAIGLLVVDFLDTLPGKQLTTDFWLQMQGLFVDPSGIQITQDQLRWFVKVASRNAEPVTDIAAALQLRQPLLLAAGDPEIFQLEARPIQVAHAPSNPLTDLKAFLQYARLEDVLARLHADEHFCPGGRIRADLRATLKVELAPVKKVLDGFWNELEM